MPSTGNKIEEIPQTGERTCRQLAHDMRSALAVLKEYLRQTSAPGEHELQGAAGRCLDRLLTIAEELSRKS